MRSWKKECVCAYEGQMLTLFRELRVKDEAV